jgi:hypothetical protein
VGGICQDGLVAVVHAGRVVHKAHYLSSWTGPSCCSRTVGSPSSAALSIVSKLGFCRWSTRSEMISGFCCLVSWHEYRGCCAGCKAFRALITLPIPLMESGEQAAASFCDGSELRAFQPSVGHHQGRRWGVCSSTLVAVCVQAAVSCSTQVEVLLNGLCCHLILIPYRLVFAPLCLVLQCVPWVMNRDDGDQEW